MVLVNFYFIHAKWLTNRSRIMEDFKRFITEKAKNITINSFEIIHDFDPSDINNELVKMVNYAQVTEPNLAFYNNFIRNMHVHQLSNTLKHFKALEKISQRDDDIISIVLEDDILYEESAINTLEKALQEMPVNCDIMFLGFPSNNPIDHSKLKFQTTTEMFKILPYCDSYIITREAAKKLYDNYLPLKFVTNIHISFLIEKLELKSYQCVPNVFIDGSKYGAFASSLASNNVLVFNGDYNAVKTIVSKETISKQEEDLVETLFEKSQIKEHPDFIYLQGLYLIKKQKYKDAEKIFESTYNRYKSLNCIMNHESTFLKDYIRLFKNLQTS